MSHEAKQWVYASRRIKKGQSGGMHVYIDSDTLRLALQNTNIPINNRLMVKRYPLKSNGKTAKILISIKEVKK